MNWRSFSPRILQLGVALGAALAALGCPAAGAATSFPGLETCAGQRFEQPFVPWADPASYTLAPGGAFEGGPGWTLRGARVVSGNEPFRVHAAGDSRALQMPAGSSATSPWMCVGLLYPTVRTFAVRSGSAFTALRVEVIWAVAGGGTGSATIALLPASTSWAPTAPFALLGNLPATIDPSHAAIQLRLSVVGSGATWRVDDVYVDPFRKS
jgi:hypothetical protein